VQSIFSFLSIPAFNSYELTTEIAQSTTLKKQCFQSAAIKTGCHQSALRGLTQADKDRKTLTLIGNNFGYLFIVFNIFYLATVHFK